MIPVFRSVIRHFSDYDFILAAVSTVNKDCYAEILNDNKIKIVFDKT